MRKLLTVLLVLLTLTNLSACADKALPLPETEEGVRGELGIDKNINEKTIDKYLNRDDCVYRDMRMLVDEANYEAIGGDSYLSGFVKGFEVVPYPYLCNVEGLPEEVGNSYTGVTLFSHIDGEYVANYKESLQIIESLFPRDKNILLMCGGGGYAGMTKQLLVGLGYDENKIYNVGGYWYYEGKNKVEVKYEEDGEIHYNFSLADYHEINFETLTLINESGNITPSKNVDESIKNSDFIQLTSLQELAALEDDNKTFPLFVFLSGCTSCAKFFPIVEEFSKNNNIQMYSIDLGMDEIWKTDNSVSEKVDYAPSMMIYQDGKVIAYLLANSDDDLPYYKSLDKLTQWFNTYIDINKFEKMK